MKPDGVATAAMAPMEPHDDVDVMVDVPPPGEEPSQGTAPDSQQSDLIGAQLGEELGQGEPHTQPIKEIPASKTTENSKMATPTDPKSKTNAPPSKTKPGSASLAAKPRPLPAQSRITNGITKPSTNGVAKKTPGPVTTEKKPSISATKRPTSAPAATNGTKPTGLTANRKPPATTATNGVKTAATAAKKSPALSKPSPTAAPKTDRPPVAKTTRPPTGTAAPRPASAPRPATGKSSAPVTKPSAPVTKTTTPKTPTSTTKTPVTKPATPKTPTASTRPTSSTVKTPTPRVASSTTPSAGRTPTSQPTKTTTPIKKDVSKPSTPATKKLAPSPLSRPPTATKTSKPDTPKPTAAKTDATTPKKPNKAADPKTTKPSKPATPSKESSSATKPPSSKPGATKASSPKKAVGSITPMAVKRGPKPSSEPPSAPNKEEEVTPLSTAAAVNMTAALTVATAAAAIAATETSEPLLLLGDQEAELVVAPPLQEDPTPLVAFAPQELEDKMEQLHLGVAALDTAGQDQSSSLGTTVLSPPCSPPGPLSPARDPPLLLPQENSAAPASLGLMDQTDPWSHEPSATPMSTLVPSPPSPPCLFSPSQEKEEAVEKADQENNDDDDDEEEEEEEEERKISQPEWHGGEVLVSMECEEEGGSTGSHHQVEKDSNARMEDFSLLTGSSAPVQESCGREEDEEEEEEEEDRVTGWMAVSAERELKCTASPRRREEEEEEEDEDVEMPSDGGIAEGDFNDEERRQDNLNHSSSTMAPPSAGVWGQSVYSEPWSSQPQPPHHQGDHAYPAAVISPARSPLNPNAAAWVPAGCSDGGLLSSNPWANPPSYDDHTSPSPTLSPSYPPFSSTAPANLEQDEEPEYDSSSGVESRSDRQQLPPLSSSSHQGAALNLDQDLGIHLGAGEDPEEAETLPADELPGGKADPVTGHASSSPSTPSDSDASDTEGEMQINEPDSPPPCSLPALREDQEDGPTHAEEEEEEEEGGSYGFDGPSSNAPSSTAGSCGKSPGIFSLENEEVGDDAKDPSLIQELTQTPLPLGGAKALLEEEEEEEGVVLPGESQPQYYSAIGDKTDRFLEGNV